MKSNLLTGLLAAVAAILLPLVILGMAPPHCPLIHRWKVPLPLRRRRLHQR